MPGSGTATPDWRVEARSRRLKAAVKSRCASLISVYVVLMVSVVLFLFAIKQKPSACQSHAKKSELIAFVDDSIKQEVLIEWVEASLAERGFAFTHTNKSLSGRTHTLSSLDTASHLLRENSLQLLEVSPSERVTDPEGRFKHEYTLRYRSEDFCLDRSPFSMNPGYSEESRLEGRDTLAIRGDGSPHYYFETHLSTTDEGRLQTTSRLAIALPFARAILGLKILKLQESFGWDVTSAAGSPLYYRSQQMPSASISFEHWSPRGPALRQSFHLVKIRFGMMEEEGPLVRAHASLLTFLDGHKALCPDQCGTKQAAIL